MLRSATSTERILRTAVVTVLVCGYAAWSLWDGYVAYPRANVESAFRNKIGMPPPHPLPDPRSGLTNESVSRIPPNSSLTELSARWGEPDARDGNRAYYFGHGGLLEVDLGAAEAVSVEWVDGPRHSATDLQFQKTIGFALLPLGLLLLAQMVRVLGTRAVLDEKGLWVRGKPFVPFEAMKDLKADSKGRAGCCDLLYETAGRSARLRLDEYVLAETPAIVREICRKKGFTMPATIPAGEA